MQIATISLALGGDPGNTIQKFSVTPAEVAVLRLIHGNDSVTEVDVYDDPIKRTNRAELERLRSVYGKPQPTGGFRAEAVDALFPGVAARVFETFDELDVADASDNFFKGGPKAEPVVADTVDLAKMNKTQLLTLAEQNGVEVSAKDTKPDIVQALQESGVAPADAAAEDDKDDSGIADMPDANMFK